MRLAVFPILIGLPSSNMAACPAPRGVRVGAKGYPLWPKFEYIRMEFSLNDLGQKK